MVYVIEGAPSHSRQQLVPQHDSPLHDAPRKPREGLASSLTAKLFIPSRLTLKSEHCAHRAKRRIGPANDGPRGAERTSLELRLSSIGLGVSEPDALTYHRRFRRRVTN